MCESCGCSSHDPSVPHFHSHAHAHPHDHAHPHNHHHPDGGTEIPLAASALALNQRHADENRGWFRAKALRVLNLLSSPGSGKTALLEWTLPRLPRSAAIVGDLQTDNDARRLQATDAPAVQINTGNGCHLTADAVGRAAETLLGTCLPPPPQWLFVENVGNLVCPVSFDLGEERRVTLLSVTEGEDKPLKYPMAFHTADLVLITKMDLAAAVGFDESALRANLARVAPASAVLPVSVRTGLGLDDWLSWLQSPPS